MRPPGISSGEHFGILELLEILMVSLDQDLVVGALELVSPWLHCVDNRQELPFVRVVVLCRWRTFLRVQIDCAKNPESVELVKHVADSTAAFIGLKNDQFCGLKCWKIGASVKAFLSFQNSSSAS